MKKNPTSKKSKAPFQVPIAPKVNSTKNSELVKNITLILKKKEKKDSSARIQKKLSAQRKRRIKINGYFATAGIETPIEALIKRNIILSLVASIVSSILFSIYTGYISVPYELIKMVVFIIVGTPAYFLVFTLLWFFFVDIKIENRSTAIEKVLPDFLHLTAANVRAGMPIDQALWSAIRPRFGVLAKEMETVAKSNMTGEELSVALAAFSRKYSSKTLTRTISLLVEGIEAGSEIGDLLENVALNIQDLQTRRESMAANVTTYVIFISFSVAVAAPALFAISIQLLRIVHQMGEKLFSGDNNLGGSFSLSTTAVLESDFLIFCIVSIIISSIMSNVIIAAIKGSSTGEVVKRVPGTVFISLLIFFSLQVLLKSLFGGII